MVASSTVTSLLTQVPSSDWVFIIYLLLRDIAPHDLVDFIKKFLISSFFSFQGQFYKQTSGTHMGSSLSTEVDDTFLESFEAIAVDSSKYKPKVWFRNVNDTFMI